MLLRVEFLYDSINDQTDIFIWNGTTVIDKQHMPGKIPWNIKKKLKKELLKEARKELQ